MAIKAISEAVKAAKQQLENLSVAELAKELRSGGDLLLADIRELQERVELGTIPGSKHVPRGMLEFWADPQSPYFRDWFSEDRRTVLFCAGGQRSALAAKALSDMGFTNVAHLETGFGGWKESAEPVEDVRSTSRWVRRDP
ncbi:MAG: rhodanese-like domain-containing protein [Myxococcota bacterium]